MVLTVNPRDYDLYATLPFNQLRQHVLSRTPQNLQQGYNFPQGVRPVQPMSGELYTMQIMDVLEKTHRFMQTRPGAQATDTYFFALKEVWEWFKGMNDFASSFGYFRPLMTGTKDYEWPTKMEEGGPDALKLKDFSNRSKEEICRCFFDMVPHSIQNCFWKINKEDDWQPEWDGVQEKRTRMTRLIQGLASVVTDVTAYELEQYEKSQKSPPAK